LDARGRWQRQIQWFPLAGRASISAAGCGSWMTVNSASNETAGSAPAREKRLEVLGPPVGTSRKRVVKRFAISKKSCCP
jgi:hypothetical protein